MISAGKLYLYLRLNIVAAINTSPIAMSLYSESCAILILILQGEFDEEEVLAYCSLDLSDGARICRRR
jgi:hypothetical protein